MRWGTAGALSSWRSAAWPLLLAARPVAEARRRRRRSEKYRWRQPEIVAQVNGEPVTRSEWQRLVQSPFERGLLLRELGLPAPDDEALGRLALRKLVHRRLLLQEAARRGVSVSERELDETIASLRRGSATSRPSAPG